MKIEMVSKPLLVLAKHLKIGDVAEVIDDFHNGEIILRYASGFVSLSNPTNDWDNSCTLEVRLVHAKVVVE